LGPKVQMISTSQAVARQTRHQLQHKVQSRSTGAGTVRLLATGDTAALQTAASRWLGLAQGTVDRLVL